MSWFIFFPAKFTGVAATAMGVPSLGYGGGLSFTANINPYNLQDPVDFAYGLAFGYGLDGLGQKLSNAIVATGSGGNGVGRGDSYGGAANGYGFGSGSSNALVYASPGYQQSFTHNNAFSGGQGGGYGQGNAVGQVVPSYYGYGGW